MKRRERDQDGYLWEARGKWWLRHSEKHADGTTARPVVCIGTLEQYDTKTKARRAAEEIMKEVNTKAAVALWVDLCDDYETKGIKHLREYSAQMYRSHINTLREAFRGERVDKLATVQGRVRMEDWLNGLKISAAYRRKHKAILRLIFRHALRLDYLRGDNPVELIDMRNMSHNTRPKRRRNVLTPEQYRALQSAPELRPLDKTILAIGHMAGLRGCECLGLSWEHGKPGDEDYRMCDIEFNGTPPKLWVRRSVKGPHIDEPKTPESHRAEPLTIQLAAILLRWKDSQPIINDWVFGSARSGHPCASSEIRRRIKEAAARLGFDYVGFGLHNPRHTFRRNMKLAGASSEEQMWALGHTSTEQNMDYGSEGFDRTVDLAPFAEKIANLLEGNQERKRVN